MVSGQLVFGKTGGCKETTPVDELCVDALFGKAGCILERGYAIRRGHAKNAHFSLFSQCNRFRKTGRERVDFTGQQTCHRFTASVIADIVERGGVFARCLHHDGCNKVIHTARNRTAADGEVSRVFTVRCQGILHRVDGTVCGHDQGRIVADGACNQCQIAEALRDLASQGADHDWGRVDHQRAFAAGRVFDQVADCNTAATA